MLSSLNLKVILLRTILITVFSVLFFYTYAESAQEFTNPEDTISLSFDTTVLGIFEQVERQTNLKFAYNVSDIDPTLEFDLEIEKTWMISELLDEISRVSELKFSRIDNYISVRIREYKKKR
ncbi:hypothetical protein [Reichenbachiella sp.]|uniref:hypothetical protein n=1 Tax=Reichenbachiella sp. TaxID=2184521 RepID=UPI0032988FCD